MLNNDFTILNNFMKLNFLNTSVSILGGSMSSFNNMDFCSKILEKSQDKSDAFGFYNGASLIYMSKGEQEEEAEGKESNVIVNLLMQMQAAQNDKNIINNKVVLKNQIVRYLEKELMFGNHGLSKTQIQNIKNAVNNYSEKNLSNVINSISKTVKKKIEQNRNSYNKDSIYIQNNFDNTKLSVENLVQKYDILNAVSNTRILKNINLNDSQKDNNSVTNSILINNKIQYDSFVNKILNKVYTGKLDYITQQNSMSGNLNHSVTQANVFTNRFINAANLVNIEKNIENNTENYLNESSFDSFVNKINSKIVLNSLQNVNKINLKKIEKNIENYLNQYLSEHSTTFNLINKENNKINYLSKNSFADIINKSNNKFILNNIDGKKITNLVNVTKNTENHLNKTAFENIINEFNNQSKFINLRNVKTANLVNLNKNIENYLNENLSKEIINKFDNKKNINKNVIIDKYTSLINNIDNSNSTERIIKTTNLVNKINNNFNSFDDIFYSKNIIKQVLREKEGKGLSKEVISKNNVYNSHKFNFKTILNVDNPLLSESRVYTDLQYLINKKQTEEIGIVKKLASIHDENKSSIKPKVKPIDIKKQKLTVKSVEQDLKGVEKVYYNDAVEQLGQEFVVLKNNVRQAPLESVKPLNSAQKFVYKNPVKLPQNDESDSFKKSEDVLKSQVIGAQHTQNNFSDNASNTNLVEQSDPEKQKITREEARKIIKEYVETINNIDTTVISRQVMSEVERMLRTERRRFGIIS